ncbi:MAG: NADP-dependent oxidoreductase [Gammaproteobacteria bacterium]|nr:NADP-dependent oxidoreductase [Gammaproteobacteria bacterium]MBT5201973.1 NADP-dependent oxidoreductase [Gammaproteobacteria bacterium]MBT6244668.1 NADP-dependent oxidoreductase [Gammaproteobacteria bacterium]
MSVRMNKQWRLAHTPSGGWPVDLDFRFGQEALPEPAPGQVLTRTLYLSMDPYQWGRRRNGTELPGQICHGRTVSQVVSSNRGPFEVGDYIFNTNGWQSYGLSGEGVSHFGYMHPRRLDPLGAPLSTAIGVLGMLGLTAYAGMMVQCQPRAGETVIVSAASGGVGQVAAQLAKLAGCRVVGIAGRPEKVDFCLEQLGLDACVSHLDEDFHEQLRKACPDGCDIYFENVGGKVFAAVLGLLNQNARITLCGLISQYGNTDGSNPHTVWQASGQQVFAVREVAVHPLFVGNFVDEYQERFLSEVGEYIKDNKIFYREDRWAGLEKAPQAFQAMLSGGNFGKTLVEVSEDTT